LWAGAECTLNRVGDRYLDRFDANPHGDLVENLDLLSDIGVSAIRFPVLWERVAPRGLKHASWSWSDRGLSRMRELHMKPIVGLVHHGSGPPHTSLLDPAFAEGLAEFARAVAERYPWVDGYTPVNEPLTTARFSGLYGLWHPHSRSAHDCVRILLNQCRAVILSMQAIRSVNPAAYLLQSEDLSKTHSTPLLSYQAAFSNLFRWLTFDLLDGRIDTRHPLWGYLLYHGASVEELEWFQEHACPPDILGLDHYLSSERYLDERLHLYPGETAGGNGRHQYVDVLASRVLADGPAGPKALFREAWERYRRPIAFTEVHNHCTREEQMRWFLEVWNAALELKAEGVDVRAVTAWSVFGSHGWDTLCTEPGGTYEVGVFDTQTSPPRPTAMAGLLKDLAEGTRPHHPLLSVPGWWKRDIRLMYGHSVRADGSVVPGPRPGELVREEVYRTAPLLILTQEADALTRLCHLRGIPYRVVGREDVSSPEAAVDLLQSASPWGVVVGGGEDGTVLAAACLAVGVPVATVPPEGSLDCSTESLNEMLDRLIDGESPLPEPIVSAQERGETRVAAETPVFS
jgi:dTDP-4-dehydrorhamnose reductase